MSDMSALRDRVIATALTVASVMPEMAVYAPTTPLGKLVQACHDLEDAIKDWPDAPH